MVNLTRIYTRTGDGGETRLSDNSLTRKTDLRVEAYGQVDEANAALGVLAASGALSDELAVIVGELQNELFDVGADLSSPVTAEPPWPPLRIEQPSIDRLERWCDELSADLPALVSFILPGGTPAAAQLHVARTVVRRAERAGWLAAESYGLSTPEEPAEGGVNRLALTYLNRLSDLLFIASRAANGAGNEILWVPGKQREPIDERGRAQRERIRESQRPAERPPASSGTR